MHTVGLEGADAQSGSVDAVRGSVDAGMDGAGADRGSDDVLSADEGPLWTDSMVVDSGDAGCPAQNQPSRQEVTIHLTNTGTRTLWMVSLGQRCDPYSVQQESGRNVALSLGWSCPCSCPGPAMTTYADQYYRLDPGQSFLYGWDAREMLSCFVQHDGECTGGAPGFDLTGARQPVTGGVMYRLTIGYELDLPANCPETMPMGNFYNCPAGGPQGVLPSGEAYQSRCASGLSITVPVSVPTSGDVSVNATIQ
jgi:hypothetical protein